MARKKLTDAQKQFIAGDDINNQVSQQANAEAITGISADIGANLKQELFGDRYYFSIVISLGRSQLYRN